jgi:hypothetical protein
MGISPLPKPLDRPNISFVGTNKSRQGLHSGFLVQRTDICFYGRDYGLDDDALYQRSPMVLRLARRSGHKLGPGRRLLHCRSLRLDVRYI